MMGRRNGEKKRRTEAKILEATACLINERELRQITDDFREENYVGKFQFGKVYKGVIRRKKIEEQKVIVKIWEHQSSAYKLLPGDNERRLRDERALHLHFEDRYPPNMPRLISYISNPQFLAFVYDLNPRDTLNNLLLKGCLSWPQRIKVALGFAHLLQFMHAGEPPHLPYLIRNISAAHIMLDQEYNPLLFDFSMISGGIFPHKGEILNQYVHGCHGYVDPVSARPGKWTDKCDVFSYGVILLGLLTNRVYTEEDAINHKPFVYQWAKDKYETTKSTPSVPKSECSLVHKSLVSDPLFYSEDGLEITKLAMCCVELDHVKRPTMSQVIRYLHNLLLVKRHARETKPHVYNTRLHSGLSSLKIPVLEFTWHNLNRRLCKGLSLEVETPTSSQSEGCHDLELFSYENLCLFTNGFCEESLIGKLQYGNVYRGNIVNRKVIVKTWGDSHIYFVGEGDNEDRLKDETMLFQHPKFISHPSLPKLVGFCYEGKHLGVVYDLEHEPLDVVSNLILRGSFTWLNRIKVIFVFACLLKFLHADNPPYLPYLVRNIDPAHIMLDTDYNPKLIDFGMLTGGFFGDRRLDERKNRFLRFGCSGYIDVRSALIGEWSKGSDVYAFGVVLLSIISKRLYTEMDRLADDSLTVDEYATKEYENYTKQASANDSALSRFSFVHQSLEADDGFYTEDGAMITKLGMDCTDSHVDDRPTMEGVVQQLLKLRVVQRHIDELGINRVLSGSL